MKDVENDMLLPVVIGVPEVNAIKLEPNDRVVSASMVEAGADLLLVTARGFGKRVLFEEFAVRGRSGKGVRCITGSAKLNGPVVSARLVRPDDTAVLVSRAGIGWRIPAAKIPEMGRDTRGAKLVELGSGDELASLEVSRRVESIA